MSLFLISWMLDSWRISVDIGHKSLPRHERFTTQEVISLNTLCDILYSYYTLKRWLTLSSHYSLEKWFFTYFFILFLVFVMLFSYAIVWDSFGCFLFICFYSFFFFFTSDQSQNGARINQRWKNQIISIFFRVRSVITPSLTIDLVGFGSRSGCTMNQWRCSFHWFCNWF